MDWQSRELDPQVQTWAGEQGIEVRWPSSYVRRVRDGDLAAAYNFSDSPCIDFGKFIERVPRFVLIPSDVAQLQACVVFLAEQEWPFVIRSAGHSSGGQTLTTSVVIDVRRLCHIRTDIPEAQLIEVEPAVTWLQLCQFLRTSERRPAALTDNWRTTIGGTLAVGGFGDRSHRAGLQVDSVQALRVLTLDGVIHEVERGDPLFDYTLAGRGQLGVVVGITLRTLERPWTVTAQVLKWPTLRAYVYDAIQLLDSEDYEFLRVRLLWGSELPVRGVGGHFGLPDGKEERRAGQTRARASKVEAIDFYDLSTRPIEKERWSKASPSLEFVLPLPAGLDFVTDVHAKLADAGLQAAIPRGFSVMVLRGRDAESLPLVPLPEGNAVLLAAIRPEVGSRECARLMPMLQEIAADVVAAGGRIYMMSIAPQGQDWLAVQYGPAWSVWKELKAEHDPKGLLNPGLLVRSEE